MLKLILPLFTLLITTISFSQQFEWAVSTGGPSTDHAKFVASDPLDGSIYITGFFWDSFDSDPGINTNTLTAIDASEAFLTKLDANGNHVWSALIGGTGMQSVQGMEVDNEQNILVLIRDESDIDIHKYSSSGTLLWTYSTDYGDSFWPNGMTVDGNNAVYFCGSYSDTIDFDNSANTDYLIPPGTEAGFITKVNSDGNYVWAQSYGSASGAALISDLAISADQSLYITGFFYGPVDFDPGIGSYTLSAFGSTDIYTMKLSPSGVFEWASQTGGTESNQSRNIALDSDGNSYITGFFDGTIDADPSTTGSHNLIAVGSADFLVQKLDIDGNLAWAQSFGGIGYDIPEGIAVDSDGYTYVTGNFGETADFDPGPAVYDLDAGAMDDGFLLKLTPNGDLTWAYQFAGDWFNTGFDICLDADNNIIAVGMFENETDLNPLAGTDLHNSSAYADIFAVKLSQPTVSGIEDQQTSTTLYPNPTKGEVFFSEHQEGIYQVYGTDGRLVKSGEISGTNLSLTDLKAGVYNLQISSWANTVSKRIIIQ